MKYIKTLENPEKGITSPLWIEAFIDEVWEGFHLRYFMDGEFRVSLVENNMTVLFSIDAKPLPKMKGEQKTLSLTRRYSMEQLRYQFEHSDVIAEELAHRVYSLIQFKS